MDFECFTSCLRINLVRNALPHICAALLLTALTPVIFSLTALNAQLSAQPLEMYLALTGMLLLTPVFLPEQDDTVRDVVRVRPVSYLQICALRVIAMIFILLLLYAAVMLLMKHGSCQISLSHFYGGTASAVFLGSIGFCASAFSDNTVIGYMTAIMYFILNLSAKEELGEFYLFGMSSAASLNKIWLYIGAAVLFAISFAYLKVLKKI